jgi:ATP-dependent RNA helicase DDX54/DBP10
VSNVIHFDYPASSKIFIHRSGRTARAGKKGTVYTLLAHDELYYIHETMLFAGRKLVSQGDLEDSSLAIYGQVPVQCISVWQEKINYLLAEDPDFTKLLTVSKRADIKFKKTRG